MKPLWLYTFIVSLIALLCSVGLLFIYSASSVFALEKTGNAAYYLIKQSEGIGLGILLAFFCGRLSVSFIKKITPVTFIILLALTALTLLPQFSVTIHGSHRWLRLGPLVGQPSEFLKMIYIMYLAHILAKAHHIRSQARSIVPWLIIVLLTSIVLLLQPDFGQTITLGITGCIIYFLALGSWYYLGLIMLVTLPAVVLLIATKAYRLQRILTFLNPWHDPKGSGFQIIQSLIAIGSGGIGGVGIGESKQKFFYLPMVHTDFIFSIFAEETGFIGCILLFILYGLIIIAGLKLATSCNDLYSSLLISGFFSLVALEAIINIGVVSALLPTKGLGLPFVSYGKSAIIAHSGMLGIIYSLIRES